MVSSIFHSAGAILISQSGTAIIEKKAFCASVSFSNKTSSSDKIKSFLIATNHHPSVTLNTAHTEDLSDNAVATALAATGSPAT